MPHIAGQHRKPVLRRSRRDHHISQTWCYPQSPRPVRHPPGNARGHDRKRENLRGIKMQQSLQP